MFFFSNYGEGVVRSCNSNTKNSSIAVLTAFWAIQAIKRIAFRKGISIMKLEHCWECLLTFRVFSNLIESILFVVLKVHIWLREIRYTSWFFLNRREGKEQDCECPRNEDDQAGQNEHCFYFSIETSITVQACTQKATDTNNHKTHKRNHQTCKF